MESARVFAWFIWISLHDFSMRFFFQKLLGIQCDSLSIFKWPRLKVQERFVPLDMLDLVGFPPGGVYNGAWSFTKTTVTRLAGS